MGEVTAIFSDHPRMLVVGTSGSGKTSLARAIARATGRKHIELDTLYWGPNWTPKMDFEARVVAETAGDEWVIDGNYGVVREHLWPRATTLVWLNYSLQVALYRLISRTIRRLVTGETLYAGNRESFRSAFLTRDGLLWYAVKTHPKYKKRYPLLLGDARFRHLSVIELKSPAEADRLLNEGADPFRKDPA